MRYSLLVYSEQEPWFDLAEEEAAKASEESLPKWYALFDELGKADPEFGGKELDDIRSAKTVRVRDGEVLVTDGPFAEAKEVLGGYWIISVKSKAEAIEWAKRCPGSENEMIEIRQVQELSDFPPDVKRVVDKYPDLKALEQQRR